MNLQEYERSGGERYKRLANTVCQMLKSALKTDYNVQHITAREKTVMSLKQRLKEIDRLDSDEIENHRKDLAGCRIIFYTNNDVERFSISNPLNELFDINWPLSKFHYPGPDEKIAVRLYRSLHYVVSMKAKDTLMPKYQEFEGLYCEVQVRTILEHAWAEMAHGSIYKKPKWSEFGSKRQEEIEALMEDVMQKHIVPAGYMLQKIATDMQRLIQSKKLLDTNPLDTALKARNNKERFEALIALKNDILPNYDDVPAVLPEIREKLKQIWIIADTTETAIDDTLADPSGRKEIFQIPAIIVSIVATYRNCAYPQDTYTFIRDLYLQTIREESKDQLVKLAQKLARHEMRIWKYCGPTVQVALVDLLHREKDIVAIGPIALMIANEVLDPYIKREMYSSDLVSWERAAIPVSEDLKYARQIVIDVVASYALQASGDDEAVTRAVESLFLSGHMPQDSLNSEEVVEMILSDLVYALEKLKKLALQTSLKARIAIEIGLLRYLWRTERIRERFRTSENVIEMCIGIKDKLIAFRDALNADEEFELAKQIIGYPSLFDYHWNVTNIDHKRARELFRKQQENIVDRIARADWPAWKERLTVATRIKQTVDIVPMPCADFLVITAKRKPEFAFELLNGHGILPNSLMFPIAITLFNGDYRERVKELFVKWLDEERFLVQEIAHVLSVAKDVDRTFFRQVADRAIRKKDERACIHIISKAMRSYNHDVKFWRDKIFFPCFEVLRHSNPGLWINSISKDHGNESLFSHLTKEQSNTILESIINVEHISYEVEQVLGVIGNDGPQDVLDWFGKRIVRGAQEPLKLFEAIPFSFEKLHEALQPYPREILASMFNWSRHDNPVVGWQAAYFLSRVYPNFEKPLECALPELIHEANTEMLLFISSCLRGFQGQERLFIVMPNIIASCRANNDVERKISEVIDETGVVTGEFAIVQAYQRKIELLQPWLDHESEKVSTFARQKTDELLRGIALENRRVQEELADRKLAFDEPIVQEDSCSIENPSQ